MNLGNEMSWNMGCVEKMHFFIYFHNLWTDSKVIKYLNNLLNSCYKGGRNFDETSRKLHKIRFSLTGFRDISSPIFVTKRNI